MKANITETGIFATAQAGAKPVWHQELFDQALSSLHQTAPAVTTPATYEYMAALDWMVQHHEPLRQASITAVEHAAPEVLEWALHPDFSIFANPPAILIGQIV
jgi:hypothetical protein